MFNLGIQELAVIFIIALVFIGPKQLPELAKTLGKVFRDFKRASNEITDSLQREAKQITSLEEDEPKKTTDKEVQFKLLPETDSVTTNAQAPVSASTENKSDDNKA